MFKPKGVMLFSLVIVLMASSCSGPDSDQPLLTAELPLHLEEHTYNAKIVGSEVPEDLHVSVVWNFDEPQPDWKPINFIGEDYEAIKPIQIDDGLRLPMTTSNQIRYLLN